MTPSRERDGVRNATLDTVASENGEERIELDVLAPDGGIDVTRGPRHSARDHRDSTDDHRWCADVPQRSVQRRERVEERPVSRQAGGGRRERSRSHASRTRSFSLREKPSSATGHPCRRPSSATRPSADVIEVGMSRGWRSSSSRSRIAPARREATQALTAPSTMSSIARAHRSRGILVRLEESQLWAWTKAAFLAIPRTGSRLSPQRSLDRRSDPRSRRRYSWRAAPRPGSGRRSSRLGSARRAREPGRRAPP